jgi:hypothetical protein
MFAPQGGSTISELSQHIAEAVGRMQEMDNLGSRADANDDLHHPDVDLVDHHGILIALLNEMLQKVQGPTRTLIEMTNTARVRLSVIRTIVQFDLVGKIPHEGSVSFTELAPVMGMDPALLERLLRFAFSQGIFRESAPGSGEVCQTELSRALPLLAPWFQLVLSPVTILPDLALPKALKTSQDPQNSKTATEIAFHKPFYALVKSKSHRRLFHNGLKSLSMAQTTCRQPHGDDLFLWENQPKSVIIDVGGGNGQTALEAAKRNPDLHFIVQDLEENRADFERTVPPDLQKRVLFQAHDFFTLQRRFLHQPVTFFMKWILHNWSDDRCIDILTHLLPLLAVPGSRLLVQEYVLSDGAHDYAHVRAMDMTMMTLFGPMARQRTRHEFECLFRAVDGRLKIIKVWDADEWGMKVLEAIIA